MTELRLYLGSLLKTCLYSHKSYKKISAFVAPDSVSLWPFQGIVHTESNVYTWNETLLLISFLAESAAVKESHCLQVQKCFTHELYWLSSWLCPVTVSTGRECFCAWAVQPVQLLLVCLSCVRACPKAHGALWISSRGNLSRKQECMADVSQKYSKEKPRSFAFDF